MYGRLIFVQTDHHTTTVRTSHQLTMEIVDLSDSDTEKTMANLSTEMQKNNMRMSIPTSLISQHLTENPWWTKRR